MASFLLVEAIAELLAIAFLIISFIVWLIFVDTIIRSILDDLIKS